MARNITVVPGTCPDDVWDDDHYIFPNGIFKAFAFKRKRVTLEALHPGLAVISGGVSLSDEPAASLRCNDGCDNLSILGLVFQNSPGRGIRVTGSKNVLLRGVRSVGHAIEACTLAFCPDLIVEDCEFGATVNPRTTQGDYTPDKKHGLYISHEVHNAVIRDCYFHDCPGSGFQANGKDGPINNILGQRLKFVRCGSSGTLAISFMGVVESHFENMYFEGNNKQDEFFGRLFSDGGSGPCSNVTLNDYSPPGEFDLMDADGCTFSAGIGWVPNGNGGVTPVVPVPIVEPGATLEQKVTSLEERVRLLEDRFITTIPA